MVPHLDRPKLCCGSLDGGPVDASASHLGPSRPPPIDMPTAASAPDLDLSAGPGATDAERLAGADAEGRLWRPRRVLITPDALALPHGRAMLDRAASYGAEVVKLASNRLTSFAADSAQKSYALARR